MRALGQKYMGLRPQGNHLEEMFRDTQYKGDGEHPVPVSNFLNAQCMCPLYKYGTAVKLNLLLA